MHQCLTRRCWTCMRTEFNEPASSALDGSPVVDVRGTRSGLRVGIDTRACIWVAVYLAVRVWGCSCVLSSVSECGVALVERDAVAGKTGQIDKPMT
jgi:hypothetical protein